MLITVPRFGYRVPWACVYDFPSSPVGKKGTAMCKSNSHVGCVCVRGAGGRREERAHLGRTFDGEREGRPLRASCSHHLRGGQVGHEGTWFKASRAARWTRGSTEEGLQQP